jgi:hypothetical protein
VLPGLKVDRFDVGVRKQGEFILLHHVWDKKLDIKWIIMNVYGAAQEEHKDGFLVELANFCAGNKEPYIVGGDFNILRFSSEKNKKFVPNRFSNTFNAIIHMNELRDLEFSRGKFT